MEITFEQFTDQVAPLGVTTVDKGRGHWQVLLAKTTINYYPYSARKTIYVNSVPHITAAIRHENATITTVQKVVQVLKEKELEYGARAANVNAKEHRDAICPDEQ